MYIRDKSKINEKMKKTILWSIIVAVMIIAVMIIGIIFYTSEKMPIGHLFNNDSFKTNSTEINDNYEDEKSAPIKVAEPMSKTTFNSVPESNIKPQLKVRDTFEYVERAKFGDNRTLKYKHIYNVTGIDNVNGSLCYLLKGDVYSLGDSLKDEDLNNNKLLSSVDICVDTQNGRIIGGKIITPSVRIKGDPLMISMDESTIETKGIGMYFKWLLSLKYNLSWTTTANVSVKPIENITLEIVNNAYNVVGKEIIKDRECFKIVNTKKVTMLKLNQTQELKNIIWVDTEKRIIIKQHTILLPDDIIVDEFELVSKIN